MNRPHAGFGCTPLSSAFRDRRQWLVTGEVKFLRVASVRPQPLPPRHPRSESRPCSPASSSTARSSPRCCRSRSRSPAGSRSGRCRSRCIPPIAPPTVSVTCQYPGASAQVVAETVAAPIEQQVNGVENMMYMSSTSANDGNYNLTVTFKHGIDMNLAQVLVQNRVALAMPLLPDVIKATGVTTKKQSPDILHGDRHLLDRRPVRPALPEQLRADPAPARAVAAAGHQRREDVRPARLQHADLARPGQAGDPEHDGRRRGRRDPRAEPPGGRRPDRPVADGARARRPRSP